MKMSFLLLIWLNILLKFILFKCEINIQFYLLFTLYNVVKKHYVTDAVCAAEYFNK